MHHYRAIYAFYRGTSKIGAPIIFLIDQTPFQSRRSGIERTYEFFAERKLTKGEYEEMEANREVNNRRFVVWYYKDIDYLQMEDEKYGAKTPRQFIDECYRRGFANQLTLRF